MIPGLRKGQVNWHQAFVEVALISAGVLLALAVDSWWDERAERKAEVEYLLSLQRDFETNRELLVVGIESEMRLIGYGKRIHLHLESGLDEVSATDLHKLIGDFYWLLSWEPITGTYDEMLGSGRLLYLQNDVLRRKLSQYAHNLDGVRAVEQHAWTNWFTEQSPFLRKHLVVSQLGWIGDYRSDSPFGMNLEALQSREFHNLVSSFMGARSDVVLNYQEAIVAGDEILALIEAELTAK